MTELLCVLCGVAIGGVAAWLWASARRRAADAARLAEYQARTSAAEGVIAEVRAQFARAEEELTRVRAELIEERQARTEAQTRLGESVRSFEQQKALLDDARNRLADAFKALSGEALKSNNAAFLELARKAFETLVAEARGDLGKRQEAIDGLVKPLAETLRKYEEQLRALEASRQKAYGSLEEQLRMLSATHQQLQKETGNLVTALRTPQVRGRWGECTLRRVVELAGMSQHCDFTEQLTVEHENGRLRPDMVVHLPAGRTIVIDAKCSLAAYLDALSAETDEQRRHCLERHAQQLRAHMESLAGKAYWESLDHTPEIVVMFIPGESFFAAAVDCDRSLIEDGMQKRVVLATPTTLLALLRAIAYGWRQEQIAASAREISELGRQLYERLRTMAGHLGDVGRAIRRLTESYNGAVGSFEARVLASARRFRELGAASGAEIEVLEPLDTTPRLPAAEPPAEA